MWTRLIDMAKNFNLVFYFLVFQVHELIKRCSLATLEKRCSASKF